MSRSSAERAVAALTAAGFRSDDVSVVAPDEKVTHELATEKNTKAPEGTATGVRRAGFSVPRDFSVIGFDDIQLSQFTDPPLTTVRLARAEIAVAAFHALLRTGGQGNALGSETQIKTSLVIRNSTGPVAR